MPKCTCEAWNHAWEDDDGIHLVHSESCFFYDN
jgi:hypothetical protein